MDVIPSHERRRWAILLAAGDGKRVRKLTCGADGMQVPKQFYTWGGGGSMLQWALKRASAVSPRERTIVVVARQHRRWWKHQLANLPPENILVQPRNRGTGVGILFPVIEILKRDPQAVAAVMPTDHHVEYEHRLQAAIREGFDAVERDRRRVVLVGIEPRRWENGYGWIKPAGPPLGIQPVDSFVEKPDPVRGRELMQAGALMNSFIFVGSADTIRGLVAETVPEVARRFGIFQEASHKAAGRLDSLYDTMPVCDFSKEVLEHSSSSLAVVRACGCEWADLGTPDRMERHRALQTA
jgi:mannose-1-phosphate guanylyltransferase